MDKTLAEIRRIEFKQIQYRKEDEHYFIFRKGEIPILISSPHGARHKRLGKWKEEDEYTSSISIKLAETTGAHVIYVKNQTYEDPNYTKSSKYKDAIEKAIKDHGIRFLVDIHGARQEREFKVSVGIISEDDPKMCSCRKFKPVIQEVFSDFQNPLFNLDGLNASDPRTITYFARHECGIESVQFEIHAEYRIIKRKQDSSKAIEGWCPHYEAKEEDVLKLFNHLKEMILKINEKIEAE